MNNYEGMFLLSPKLNDDALEKEIANIKGILDKNGAKIEKVETPGKKALAYKIKKFKEGIYVLVNFKVKPASIAAVEKVFKLDESILRVLIILKD